MKKSRDSSLRNLSQRLQHRAFTSDECFLCARSLADLGSTSEHIFPRWLQDRFDLWNQRLTLLNRSSIPYRYLTVPCCDECNRYQLAPIESIMAKAVEGGFSSFRQLGIEIPYLWLAKIFYGILYKELSLALKRDEPDLGSILSSSAMAEFESMLFLLQEARGVIKRLDFSAASILTFRTQVPEVIQLQWDFHDNIDSQFIACRMAEVGLIGVLQDGGVHQEFGEEFSEFQNIPLHPIQFAELCAIFSFKASLTQRTPKWVTVEGDPHQTIQLPLGGFSLKPWFAEWDPYEYAHFLAHYLGYPLDAVYKSPDGVVTYLWDESGNPRFIDFSSEPYLPHTRH